MLDATPSTPLAATYSTLHIPFSASRVRAYEHVCAENGAFSQQRRQDVFVSAGIRECAPQTNATEEKERERMGHRTF